MRRKLLANKTSLEITDTFDETLIEDIQTSAPGLQSLIITVLDGKVLDLAGISKLENLRIIQILDGPELEQILLGDLGNLSYLKELHLSIYEESKIEGLDLSVLSGNKSIEKITIDINLEFLKLDGLCTCSNLESISIRGFHGSCIDLSKLSDCPNLGSIEILNFGRTAYDDIGIFEIILPRNIPLDCLSIGGFLEENEPNIDFSVLKEQSYIDMLSLVNIGLTSFDLNLLSNAERIGHITLIQNEISEIDMTPILEKPMDVTRGAAFFVDEKTKVIVGVPIEKVEEIIKRPNVKALIENKYGTAEYTFGFQWLKSLLENYTIELTE